MKGGASSSSGLAGEDPSLLTLPMQLASTSLKLACRDVPSFCLATNSSPSACIWIDPKGFRGTNLRCTRQENESRDALFLIDNSFPQLYCTMAGVLQVSPLLRITHNVEMPTTLLAHVLVAPTDGGGSCFARSFLRALLWSCPASGSSLLPGFPFCMVLAFGSSSRGLSKLGWLPSSSS